MYEIKEEALRLAKPVTKDCEGLNLKPYLCPGGYPTIGWGHKLSNKAEDLKKFSQISLEEAERLITEDLEKAARSVFRLVKVALTAPQLAALLDFVFHFGEGNFQKSTLLKVLNEGKYEDVPEQLRRWVYSNKVKLKGLEIRQEKLVALWNS